ncbi:MAG: hypothetical protein JJ863_33345 [Deltaproteobacteria bacterium]|nr:hypothetical protein [Deltaproteobacteria bacterium]
MRRLLSFALPLALCSGCFLIASTDEFSEDEACDLELDVRAFAPHIGQTFEVRLVQNPPQSIIDMLPEDEEVRPALRFLAIFDPLQNPNLDMQVPGAVPALTDPTRDRPFLDFYADFNNDGAYSAPPADHTWRVEDPCDPDRDPVFPHNTDFFDLPRPTGLGGFVFVDFCPNLTTGDRIGPLEPFVGTEPIEVRVSGTFVPTVDGMTEEVRPVGIYRLESAATRPMGIVLPSLVDPGFNHKIEVFVDRNDDFAFDSDGDHGWTYFYDPLSAPDCDEVAMACALSPDTVNQAPICKDTIERGGESFPAIRVRLSRAHIANFGAPTERSWVSIPEGT